MTGIICVNKDKDITSFGVVAKVRGICREKKVGHTGTLDPMATGVLPIMLGGATRFLNHLPDSDKGYRASFVLGKTTDTLDITGEVTGEFEVSVGADEVKKALDNFRGEINQIPPMFSAKSVDGVRLYELARRGETVERQACSVEIKLLELVDFDENSNSYTIEILCSKGTYIRSLIDDIGRLLGCGAVMTSLVRTRAMGFSLEDCVSLEQLQNFKDNGEGFDRILHSVDSLFADYKKVCVTDAQSTRFFNGGALDVSRVKVGLEPDEICTVYGGDRGFLGLGQRINDELRVLRVLALNK